MVYGSGKWAAALLLAAAVMTITARSAHAQVDEPAVALLLDADARAEIGRELRVALAERHARVVAGTAPLGDTPLVRAAVAQRMARGLGAQLALWSEPGTRGAQLHAVLVDGSEVRHAPLPGVIAELEPRVVATVAASLVDELWQEHDAHVVEAEPAPPPAPSISVEIRLEPERPLRARAPQPPSRGDDDEPPPASVAAEPDGSGWGLAGGGAFQTGGLASFEARLAWRSRDGWCVGAWSTFGHVFASENWETVALGVELARSTRGVPSLEYGMFAGFDVVASDRPGGERGNHAGAALIGARVGVGVPMASDWRVRLDFSAAAVSSAVDGAGLLSWVSLLAERRL